MFVMYPFIKTIYDLSLLTVDEDDSALLHRRANNSVDGYNCIKYKAGAYDNTHWISYTGAHLSPIKPFAKRLVHAAIFTRKRSFVSLSMKEAAYWLVLQCDRVDDVTGACELCKKYFRRNGLRLFKCETKAEFLLREKSIKEITVEY